VLWLSLLIKTIHRYIYIYIYIYKERERESVREREREREREFSVEAHLYAYMSVGIMESRAYKCYIRKRKLQENIGYRESDVKLYNMQL
jgi:hypothetical protein